MACLTPARYRDRALVPANNKRGQAARTGKQYFSRQKIKRPAKTGRLVN